MFAFLASLIPRRDYVYGALILVLIAGFGWYTFHERAIGRQKLEAKDKAFADAQIAKNKEIEDGIAKNIQAAVDKWKQDHPIPAPIPAPHIVCHSAGSGTGTKREGPSGTINGPGTAVPVSPESVNEGFDPSQAVSTTGTAADTEIVRLKAKVTLLQDTIKAYQNGGLVDTEGK